MKKRLWQDFLKDLVLKIRNNKFVIWKVNIILTIVEEAKMLNVSRKNAILYKLLVSYSIDNIII